MAILEDTPAALYTTLQGGTALTALLAGTTSIYDASPPHGVAYPYVVFNHQGGGPELQTSKGMESNLWFVRAYSAESAKNAAQIFEQVDALLHQINISISGLTTFWCAREENIKLVETAPDQSRVWQAGGIYRIRTTA